MMKNKHNYESNLRSRRECLRDEQILTHGRNPGLEENEELTGECFSLRFAAHFRPPPKLTSREKYRQLRRLL